MRSAASTLVNFYARYTGSITEERLAENTKVLFGIKQDGIYVMKLMSALRSEIQKKNCSIVKKKSDGSLQIITFKKYHGSVSKEESV